MAGCLQRGVRHCRKERTRFRIYRQISADSAKDFKISAKISDFSEDFKISAKISDFSEDFKISAKISDFARISAEISRFHVISGEISRFQDPFSNFSRDFMVVRGRPIARARSVVPVSVRPSATQRVPECVCVKYMRECVSLTVARVMLHPYEVQYIRASIERHLLFDWVYWGCSRGCYCCSLARQPYFFLL